MREVPLYVRHNRAHDGPVSAGEAAPVDELFLAAMPAALGLAENEGRDATTLRTFPRRADPMLLGAAPVDPDADAAAALGLTWRSLREHLNALGQGRGHAPLQAPLPVAVLAGSAT